MSAQSIAANPSQGTEHKRHRPVRSTKGISSAPATAERNEIFEPFSLQQQRGTADLLPLHFELQVLERYWQDPAYRIHASHLQGSIVRRQRSAHSALNSVQRVLPSFGFADHSTQGRVVAVFISYLARLSAADQQHWANHLIDAPCTTHADYISLQLEGSWPTHRPVFEACLLEMQEINQLSLGMQRAPLWQHTPNYAESSSAFGFLLRDSTESWHSFIEQLFEYSIESLNSEFFEREQAYFQKQGIRHPLGMFSTWIRHAFCADDKAPVEHLLNTLKRIQSEQFKPKAVRDSEQEKESYSHQQRQLMQEVYTALKTLRSIFALHPANQERKAPIDLDALQVSFY